MPIRLSFLLLPLPARAISETQSALHPGGPQADLIADTTRILFIGGGLIFLLVILLAGIALFGPQAQRERLSRRGLIIGGGIAFPVLVLSSLLVYSFTSGAAAGRLGAPAVRIEVTGELWWWRIRYLDAGGGLLFETANEIRIPAGQAVDVSLRSDNVIHSFWVPSLAGKLDLTPGRVTRLRLQADAPGIYRGQCAEYCGAQHAKMAFHVIAEEAGAFDAWMAQQMSPADVPQNEQQRLGQQLFQENHCGQCHSVRGTGAAGDLGPDLTHVGSRASLAAGILPNTPGTLAEWVAGTQEIKPGSRMPSFQQFSGEELRGLAAYLANLR